MVQEIQKIHLKECKDLSFDNTSVRMFRTKEENSERQSMLRLAPKAITGFDIDYAADTYKPVEFDLTAWTEGKVGFYFGITEEMLQQMLEYIKAEKQKVYTMKELS